MMNKPASFYRVVGTLLVLSAFHDANAAASFDPATRLLSMDAISISGARYNGVEATIASYDLLGVDGGAPGDDTFDMVTHMLTLGSVSFMGSTYTNVRVRIGSYSLRKVSVPVNLSVSATAGGYVSSAPSGINCTNTSSTGCASSFAQGATVVLSAVATSGYTFSSWGGACSGALACTVTMDGVKTVLANFISVTPTTTGGGTTPGTGTGRMLSVATTGSTTSDCISTPCKTIQRAESLAQPGDTIEVHGGTYGELQVRHWGRSDKWITLRAAAGEQVVVRGAGIGPSIYFYDSLCDEYAPSGSVCPSAYWRLEGLTVQGSAAGQGDGNAIKIDLSDVTITNSKLCCSYADIVKAVRTADRITLDHNEFWQDTAVTPISQNAQGVDKTGGSDLKVINNYFHDIPDVGVYAKGNACRPLFDNNLFYNTGTSNGGSALMLGQQTDASRLVKGCGAITSPYYESYDGVASNNLIINAVGGCVGVSSSHNARVLNNKCINTATAGDAVFQMTNESVALPRPGYPNGRQPSDYVEFRGNVVQNATGRMFRDSDLPAIEDWSNFVVADNVWFATSPLSFKLAQSSLIYNSGTYAQWLVEYKKLTGHTDNSTTANPNLNASTLMADWLRVFRGQ